MVARRHDARAPLDLLSFTYRDSGSQCDDRLYLIRSGEVRACYLDPVSPLEREMFAGVVAEECARPLPPAHRVDAEQLHERLLVLSWFRTHPEAGGGRNRCRGLLLAGFLDTVDP